jgi:hypothetical protein
MSASIEINGLKLVPLKEAAKSFSYTRDYVARLAREEKIVASQLGRQWYIDLLSLKNFAHVAELEQKVRRKYLSEERKNEQVIKAQILSVRDNLRKKKLAHHNNAARVAVSVLLLGLFSGAGLYLADGLSDVSLSNQVVAVPSPASDADLSGFSVVEPKPFAIYQTQTENLNNEVFEVFEVVEPIKDSESGILLLAKGADANSEVLEVSDLFSDDVSIVMEDGSAGVIIYRDRSGNTRERDFISVPADPNPSELAQ